MYIGAFDYNAVEVGNMAMVFDQDLNGLRVPSNATFWIFIFTFYYLYL